MAFKYLRDPLFLLCLSLYFVNRWILKPLFPGGFFHNSLNDLICIPFWVPIQLWAMRQTRLRDNDDPPQCYEILIPVVVWSVVFEMVVPKTATFQRLSHADPADILAYVAGAVLASLWWRGWYDRSNGTAEHANLNSRSV
ncbi:hypothetical protein EON80_10040 [bacterium]|nr:MAG: hypothetical protein EON80_10040 [bacterium]